MLGKMSAGLAGASSKFFQLTWFGTSNQAFWQPLSTVELQPKWASSPTVKPLEVAHALVVKPTQLVEPADSQFSWFTIFMSTLGFKTLHPLRSISHLLEKGQHHHVLKHHQAVCSSCLHEPSVQMPNYFECWQDYDDSQPQPSLTTLKSLSPLIHGEGVLNSSPSRPALQPQNCWIGTRVGDTI